MPAVLKKVRSRGMMQYRRSVDTVADVAYRKGDYQLRVSDSAYSGESMPCVLPGTYETYRRMDRSPYLAMAREYKAGPVVNATGVWKSKPNTPDTRLAFVQGMLEPLIPDVLKSLVDALSMGNSPNMILWDLETKPTPGVPNVHWVIREVRPVDHCESYVRVSSNDDWEFQGLTIRQTDFAPDEVLYYRYDPRPYYGYWWYGRSLHENIRREFTEYEADRQLMHRLARKLSGVVAIANIIKGMARDSSGNAIDRFPAATEIVNTLVQSMGAVFETIAFDSEEIKRNPKLADVTDIKVNALDLGSSSPAYETMLKKRQQMQQEMVMGWLVGPRSIMESQYGSRADSESQAESTLTQSEVLGLLLHKAINEQLVDRVLVLNFGEEAKGTVWREPTKFTEAQRRTSTMLLNGLVNNPVLYAAALKVIDVAGIFRNTGTPTLNNVDSIELDIKNSPLRNQGTSTPPIKPLRRDTKKPSNNPTGSNGNGRI